YCSFHLLKRIACFSCPAIQSKIAILLFIPGHAILRNIQIPVTQGMYTGSTPLVMPSIYTATLIIYTSFCELQHFALRVVIEPFQCLQHRALGAVYCKQAII